MPLNHPLLTIHLNPQRFNLDATGFTLVVKPADIVDILLSLKPHQLNNILRHIRPNKASDQNTKLKPTVHQP